VSGPPYPHPNPVPGSNQIGQFQIGVSPIGTIPAFDVWTTVLAQYANSPTLTGMITAFNAAMDMTQNLDNFYDLIMNVLTAQGYGLDVWGRIVVAPRTIAVAGGGPATFGFNEPGNDWVGWNQAPFTQGPNPSGNVTLTDVQYRPLVLAKAATNLWDGSISKLNSILLALFSGRGHPYVRDTLNMGITYVFDFVLTPLDLSIIQSSGVLPQPTGVVVNISAP
jgi:hypothetical protein